MYLNMAAGRLFQALTVFSPLFHRKEIKACGICTSVVRSLTKLTHTYPGPGPRSRAAAARKRVIPCSCRPTSIFLFNDGKESERCTPSDTHGVWQFAVCSLVTAVNTTHISILYHVKDLPRAVVPIISGTPASKTAAVRRISLDGVIFCREGVSSAHKKKVILGYMCPRAAHLSDAILIRK